MHDEAHLDFETYSEAGFLWDESLGKWRPLPGAPTGGRNKGLSVVGAAAYSEHPTTEVLTMSFWLPGDAHITRWKPGDPWPTRLFDWIAQGRPVRAHNSMFEYLIWHNVCLRLYGFPPFPLHIMRCSMATARVNSRPGALKNLSDVLALPTPKDKRGEALLKKFSIPRDPTKNDPSKRHLPREFPEEFEGLQAYCDTDILAEYGVTERLTPMTPDELTFWWVDQEINFRGLGVDRKGVRDCTAILDAALDRYGAECKQITGLGVSQLAALLGWIQAHGVTMYSMDAEAVEAALKLELPPVVRRVLELRQLCGSAAVKKVYAMELSASHDDRIRNLIVHHGARTGRPTGGGAQPLNMPRDGPPVKWCACGKPHGVHLAHCPFCGVPAVEKVSKWSPTAVEHVLEIMATRSLDVVEYYYGDALLAISGCLRGLFVAAPGYELVASDYSAIEAVVIAMLAGEQWRIDAFREKKPIYLLGASKITGRSLEYYLEYHATQGEHHADRQLIGKVSELACGFGGWIGSYKAFGSTADDATIKAQILAWRAASPAIVEFWGGQFRGKPWDRDAQQEYFGVEGYAVAAILYPDMVFDFRGIKFHMRGKALIITLLSGRELTYHDAELRPASGAYSRPGEYSITYMTWNSNPKYGALGWVPMDTYGGRLTENIVQATAHDLLRHAILNLRAAGYPTVLHVYDEIVCEVPIGTANLEHFENIMRTNPPWAADWPVDASGGWVGRRYRKG